MAENPDDVAVPFRHANTGDEAAYRLLLTRLAPLLRAFIRSELLRAGRSADDCEDVVQETLISIHLKRQSWDASQPVEPWVRAIARHKLIDFLHRRGHHGHLDIDDLADSLPAATSGDVVAMIDRKHIMCRLPERARHIVEAFSVRGLSAREIAEEMGMTEGAVRVALRRALELMADRAGGRDR